LVDLLDKKILETIKENTSPESSDTLQETELPTHISFPELKKNLTQDASDEMIQKRLENLVETGFLNIKEEKWRLTFKGRVLLEDFWDTLSKIEIGEEEKEQAEEIEKPIEKEKIEEKPTTPKPPLTSPQLSKSLEEISVERKQAQEFLTQLNRSYDAGLIDDELYQSFRDQFSKRLDELEYTRDEKIQLSRAAQMEEDEVTGKIVQILPELREESRAVKTRGILDLLSNKPALLVITGFVFLLTGFLLIAEVYEEASILLLGLNAWIITLSIGIVFTLLTGISISLRGGEKEESKK